MIILRKAMAKALVLLSVLLVAAIIGTAVVWHMPSGPRYVLAFAIGADYVGTDGVVFQTNGKNCGAAVLKMICDHYNVAVPLSDIDSSVEVTNRGASMFALKNYAESKKLSAAGWKLTYDEFERKPFPMILFVNNNHYIVADSAAAGEVFLRDPAIGRLKITKRNFLKIWKGEALTFSARQHMMPH